MALSLVGLFEPIFCIYWQLMARQFFLIVLWLIISLMWLINIKSISGIFYFCNIILNIKGKNNLRTSICDLFKEYSHATKFCDDPIMMSYYLLSRTCSSTSKKRNSAAIKINTYNDLKLT